MFLDNEINIINSILDGLDDFNVLQYNSNSFTKKIFRYIQNLDKFVENNNHDSLPPDFYSDEFSCMFDVMRINDSEDENNKSCNPVKKRERILENDIKKTGILDEVSSSSNLFISSENNNDSEHTLKKYIKNCDRVMSKHIKKINIWESEHPFIKHKGLLIYDETECYFEGQIRHINADNYLFMWDRNKPLVLHKPWMDSSFIKKAYDSDLDFIIWCCPYKSNSSLLEQMHCDYPDLVILDTRFPRENYVQYDISKLVSM